MLWRLQLLSIPVLSSYADTTTELLGSGEKREEEEILQLPSGGVFSSPLCTVYSTWTPCKSIPVSQSRLHYTCHVARGLLLGLCQAENSTRRLQERVGLILKKNDFFQRALES